MKDRLVEALQSALDVPPRALPATKTLGKAGILRRRREVTNMGMFDTLPLLAVVLQQQQVNV
jgi:hypothetical protein